MTPRQQHAYDALSSAGYEFSHNGHDGTIFMDRYEHGPEHTRILESRAIEPDGSSYEVPVMNGPDRCDYCNTPIIDHCPRCGAPQCCPKCCREGTMQALGITELDIQQAMPPRDALGG